MFSWSWWHSENHPFTVPLLHWLGAKNLGRYPYLGDGGRTSALTQMVISLSWLQIKTWNC